MTPSYRPTRVDGVRDDDALRQPVAQTKGYAAANAFDGEGARLEGGRWNSPGTPLVDTSGSAALAALEMLVHLGRLSAYVLIACTFEERLVERLDPKRLPPNWRSYPAPPDLRLIGDEWAKTATAAVLQVPSAVIETESNYLLNPQHQDFKTARVGDPQPFDFDERLLKR